MLFALHKQTKCGFSRDFWRASNHIMFFFPFSFTWHLIGRSTRFDWNPLMWQTSCFFINTSVQKKLFLLCITHEKIHIFESVVFPPRSSINLHSLTRLLRQLWAAVQLFRLIISYLDSRTSPVILWLGSHLAVCREVLHGFQPHELFCLPRTANCCCEGLLLRQWWKLQATATWLHGKWLCWRRLIPAVLVQAGWEENHDSAFLCHDLKSAWIILGGKKDPEG